MTRAAMEISPPRIACYGANEFKGEALAMQQKCRALFEVCWYAILSVNNQKMTYFTCSTHSNRKKWQLQRFAYLRETRKIFKTDT